MLRRILRTLNLDFKVYTPAELKQLKYIHCYDTIYNQEFKSIWINEKGNTLMCTHSSKSKVDSQGRCIYDENIVNPKYLGFKY